MSQLTNKPWDGLRKPVLAPIGVGTWGTCGGSVVSLSKLTNTLIGFSVNSGNTIELSWQSARELGEFLIELSHQIEGKKNG